MSNNNQMLKSYTWPKPDGTKVVIQAVSDDDFRAKVTELQKIENEKIIASMKSPIQPVNIQKEIVVEKVNDNGPIHERFDRLEKLLEGITLGSNDGLAIKVKSLEDRIAKMEKIFEQFAKFK